MSVRPPTAKDGGAGGVRADAVDRVARSAGEGVRWSVAGEALDVNLVAWLPRHGVARHVNGAVDVLLVGLRGHGTLEIDAQSIPFGPGSVHLVPKRSRRSLRATTRLVYVTCHPRRSRTFAPEELVGPRTGSAR